MSIPELLGKAAVAPAAAAATATAATDTDARPAIAAESGLRSCLAVLAAIVDGDDLDIVVIPAAVDLFVFDSDVREVHLLVEVRQVVLLRPLRDLLVAAIGVPVVVVAVPIPLVEPLLVLALELVVELDAVYACAALRKALGFSEVRAIHLKVVFQRARLLQPRVVLLAMVVPMVLALVMRVVAPIRLQQDPTFFREDDGDVPMTVQPFGSDEAFRAQVSQVAR